MEGHRLQINSVVKEEPNEYINGVPSVDIGLNLEASFILKTEESEMELSSTVEVEETTMNNMKIEEHCDEKGSILDNQKDALQILPLAREIARRKIKSHIHPNKLFKIAQDFSDLYPRLAYPNPIAPQWLGLPFKIIVCSGCGMERATGNRASVLVDLLRHVNRSHPADCTFLYSIIFEENRRLVDHMKKKITKKQKTRYSLRLKSKRNL